jgi:endonuclease/exonuclease/phosphatase family metal-dependent hydrolase
MQANRAPPDSAPSRAINRRLTQSGDTVWAKIDDGQPAKSDLTAVTENMPISCRDNHFTEFIDHIVTDRRASAFVDRSSFRHVTYRQEDKPVWHLISDHCPVVVELWVP